LQPDQTLVFVSHYAEEVPNTVNRRLRLEGGAVAEVV
jgi:ABC-type molybdenum transport system ATPase subunit/photorepair protein PhrA